MKVSKDKVVTLTYSLRLNDGNGELVQEVTNERPFVHLFGAGNLLPAFENNLDGLEPGDDFGFFLPSDEAYGNQSDEAIIELEKSIFEAEGKIDEEMVAVGKMLVMQDQNGNPLEGVILAIKDKTVIMDFNHPLAGENLYFSGNIIDVRDASKEEQEHGHVHGAGGHHH
ncbi:MAG: FKBP-type peptidyl-prolyl cis-trans isomerase [Bacteroidales bacterium]|nr:FKBP-type peptidyl-prolyl cis-trans isomerase [Bacteroidales bacterium]